MNFLAYRTLEDDSDHRAVIIVHVNVTDRRL